MAKLMNLIFLLVCGCSGVNLRGGLRSSPFFECSGTGSVHFANSSLTRYGPQFSMSGVSGDSLDVSVEQQAKEVLHKVKKSLEQNNMAPCDLVLLEVLLADIADWPAVHKLMTQNLLENVPNASVPNVAIVPYQPSTAGLCDGAKVELNIIAQKQQTQEDYVKHAQFQEVIISDISPADTITMAEGMAAILPRIESQLEKLRGSHWSKHNFVFIEVQMEKNTTTSWGDFMDGYSSMNDVYNEWMSGAVLPSMIAIGVAAFPGSDAPGMQIQVSVTATPVVDTNLGAEANLQVAPTQDHSDNNGKGFVLPFANVAASSSLAWQSAMTEGATFDQDMRTQARIVLGNLESQLKNATGLDFDSVVRANVCVTKRGATQIGQLIEVWNSFFGEAAQSTPTLGLKIVERLGGGSEEHPGLTQLEIALMATRGGRGATASLA